jgi:hypothetical protein
MVAKPSQLGLADREYQSAAGEREHDVATGSRTPLDGTAPPGSRLGMTALRTARWQGSTGSVADCRMTQPVRCCHKE